MAVISSISNGTSKLKMHTMKRASPAPSEPIPSVFVHWKTRQFTTSLARYVQVLRRTLGRTHNALVFFPCEDSVVILSVYAVSTTLSKVCEAERSMAIGEVDQDFFFCVALPSHVKILCSLNHLKCPQWLFFVVVTSFHCSLQWRSTISLYLFLLASF